MMNEVDTLKQKIEDERIKHKKELERIKPENYDALEASQTRYQA